MHRVEHAVEVAEGGPDRGVLVAGGDRVDDGAMVVGGQRRGVDALGEVVRGAGGLEDAGEQVGQHRIVRGLHDPEVEREVGVREPGRLIRRSLPLVE